MEQNAREADQGRSNEGRSNEGRSNEGRSNEGRSNEGSSEATPARAHSSSGTFLESSTRGIPPDEDGSSTCSVARRSVTLEGGARGSQPAWDASTVAEETAPEAIKSSASGDLRATAEVTAFPLWSRLTNRLYLPPRSPPYTSPPVAPLHRPRPLGVHPPGTPPHTHTPPYPSLPVLQGYFPVPKPQPHPCTAARSSSKATRRSRRSTRCVRSPRWCAHHMATALKEVMVRRES